MVKNIITLFLSLILIIFLASNKVSALKERGYDSYYYESENRFLNTIGIEKLRDNFSQKFEHLISSSEKNKMLIKENKDLNSLIKKRLEQSKSNLGSEIWKEIREYKNKINDKKMATYDRVNQLIDAQRKVLELSNYSDDSLSDFMDAMINAQGLKRESIEFEKSYLDIINGLIV